MRRLYSFLLFLALPIIFCRLYVKGRLNPLYRQRWKERLGFVSSLKRVDQKIIWIHAVSVGEVEATAPLVTKLFDQFPNIQIVITTTTPTGSETVERRYPEQFNKQIKHYYIPYDLVCFLQRFIDRINPKLMIIMETEVWPNLIHVCNKRKLPVMLANGRMSERSCKGYQRLSVLLKSMFSKINIIAAQTGQDAKRFITLGADPEDVIVVGNLKFDQKLPEDIEERSLQLKEQLGSKRPTWIAASTHEGEEEKVLSAHQKILKKLPNCLLVLVPRHPERFDQVFDLCNKSEFKTVRRSDDQKNIDPTTQIYLVDTMGDLLLCYSAADVAFVAGSLAEIGGHNLLEPASLGSPILMGPHTFKIEKIFQKFLDENAAVRINNENELTEKALYFLQNDRERISMGKRAKDLVEQNQGSAERHLELIKRICTVNERR